MWHIIRTKKYVPTYVKKYLPYTIVHERFSIKFDPVFPYTDTHKVSIAHKEAHRVVAVVSQKTLNLHCHLTEVLLLGLLMIEDLLITIST